MRSSSEHEGARREQHELQQTNDQQQDDEEQEEEPTPPLNRASKDFTWLEVFCTTLFWAALYWYIFHYSSASQTTEAEFLSWTRYYYFKLYNNITSIGGTVMAAYGLYYAYTMLSGGPKGPGRGKRIKELARQK